LEALPNNAVPFGSVQCVKVSAVGVSEQTGFSSVVAAGGGPPTGGVLDVTGPYDKTGNVTGHGKNDYSMIFKMALWDMKLPNVNAPETDTNNLQLAPNLYSSGSKGASGSLVDTPKISGAIYRLHFNGNPGALREPEIEIYLDQTTLSFIMNTQFLHDTNE
jgi:hypothetical protein